MDIIWMWLFKINKRQRRRRLLIRRVDFFFSNRHGLCDPYGGYVAKHNPKLQKSEIVIELMTRRLVIDKK